MPIYIHTDHNNDKNIHCLRKKKNGQIVHDQIINNALYTEKEWQAFIFRDQVPSFQTVNASYKQVGFIFGVLRLINVWEG